MNWIWNVMLSFSFDEFWEDGEDEPREACEPLERINRWMAHGELVDLTGPTYAEGVGYGMHANLYGGGFKHFDIEEFIETVEAQDWKDRENVQLWVKGEEEESFTLIKLRRRPSRPRPEAQAARQSKPTLRRRQRRKARGASR